MSKIYATQMNSMIYTTTKTYIEEGFSSRTQCMRPRVLWVETMIQIIYLIIIKATTEAHYITVTGPLLLNFPTYFAWVSSLLLKSWRGVQKLL